MKSTVEHIIKEEFYYDSLNKSPFKSCEKQVISYSIKLEDKEVEVITLQIQSQDNISAIKESELIEFISKGIKKKESNLKPTINIRIDKLIDKFEIINTDPNKIKELESVVKSALINAIKLAEETQGSTLDTALKQ